MNFIQKMEKTNKLAAQPATLFAVKGPEGFYGGESGGTIWAKNPAFGYHFPTQEAAAEFARSLPGAEAVEIRSGMWNLLLMLRMYQVPVPEEILEWEKKVEAATKEVSAQAEAFVKEVVGEALRWASGFMPERRVHPHSPDRIRMWVETGAYYGNKPPAVIFEEDICRYEAAEDPGEKVEGVIRRNPFYLEQLQGCPILRGPAHAGGWSEWYELDRDNNNKVKEVKHR